MGAKVSVTTASHATSAASRSNDAAATRDSPVSAGAAKGFSSAMSAAARPPAPHDPGSDTRADAARTPNGSSEAKSSGTTTTASPQKASTSSASSASSAQAPTAAATVAEADVSSIDADTATAEGKAPEKGGTKSRTASTDNSSTAADAATMALLLAASGMQVDARAGSGQQSQNGDAGSAADDNSTTAIGGNLALSSLATAGVGLPAITGAAAGGAAAVTGATAASAGQTAAPAQVAQLSIESLSLGSTLGDQSGADSSLFQDKSGAPDSTPAQATSSTTPNGVAQMIRDLTSAATQSASVERTIAVPVSDGNWSGAVAGQVQWMVSNNVQSATLQLSPEHLGPLEVRIDMQPSSVNVSFTASHPDTRSALEQSVPQLRAILAHGGLTLGQTSVQQEPRSGSQYAPQTPRSSTAGAQNVESVSVSSLRGLGLIDEYV
jgi:flagellar hook-length control protein FliK